MVLVVVVVLVVLAVVVVAAAHLQRQQQVAAVGIPTAAIETCLHHQSMAARWPLPFTTTPATTSRPPCRRVSDPHRSMRCGRDPLRMHLAATRPTLHSSTMTGDRPWSA